MNLNLFENMKRDFEKMNVSEFINSIIERMNKMEEELVIDRFEENIAVCEDRNTGEKKEILKDELPEGISEGDVIKKENGKYVIQKEKQEEIEKRIKDKMDILWKD